MMLSPTAEHMLLSMAALVPWQEPPQRIVPIRPELLNTAILRPYQIDLILEVARLMRQGIRRILIQLPTGGGKTQIAAAIVAASQALNFASAAMLLPLNLPSQFIVHRKELIKQTSVSFLRADLVHGFIAAGWQASFDASVTLAGIQTLVNRLGLILPPNLVIVDECHHAVSGTWASVLEQYRESFVIGLTATPERLDGRGLGEHFDVMVCGPSVAWLIEQGYLSQYDFYAPTIPDMSAVPVAAGEFARGAAAEVVDKPKIIGDIVEHYLRLAPGEQGIVFAASREHSRHIADAFKAEGVPAMHVDGSMDDKARDYFDKAFRAGDIRIGCNVDLFGEGYDVPNIGYVGDGAPTLSMIKVRQRWGRALRPAPGKERAVICDHVGNAVDRQHGLPDDDIRWSLEGKTARSRNGSSADGVISVRQCKHCYLVSRSAVTICPRCGTAFPSQAREITQEAGTLSKLDRERLKAERELQKRKAAALRKAEEKACKEYADFYHLAVRRSYNNPVGWAKMKASFKTNYRGSR